MLVALSCEYFYQASGALSTSLWSIVFSLFVSDAKRTGERKAVPFCERPKTDPRARLRLVSHFQSARPSSVVASRLHLVTERRQQVSYAAAQLACHCANTPHPHTWMLKVSKWTKEKRRARRPEAHALIKKANMRRDAQHANIKKQENVGVKFPLNKVLHKNKQAMCFQMLMEFLIVPVGAIISVHNSLSFFFHLLMLLA